MPLTGMEKHWGRDRKEAQRPGTPEPGGPKDSGCASLWEASAAEGWAGCLGEWAEARATGLRRGSEGLGHVEPTKEPGKTSEVGWCAAGEMAARLRSGLHC